MLEPTDRADPSQVTAVPPLRSRLELPPMRRQFRMVHLVVAVGVTAVILAVGTQFGGAGIALAVGAEVAFITAALVWWFRRPWPIMIPFSLPLVFCVFAPMFQQYDGGASPRGFCLSNMRNVTMALHAYHAEHQSFPPAYVTDANGKPLYSWRVLILPYIEEHHLYNEFHLDEPWDTAHNLRIAQRVPRVFHCPKRAAQGVTNYVAVIGEHTMWAGATAVTLNDLTDDPAETLLIVEWCESDIFWSEPRDLTMEDVRGLWQPPIGNGLNDRH